MCPKQPHCSNIRVSITGYHANAAPFMQPAWLYLLFGVGDSSDLQATAQREGLFLCQCGPEGAEARILLCRKTLHILDVPYDMDCLY